MHTQGLRFQVSIYKVCMHHILLHYRTDLSIYWNSNQKNQPIYVTQVITKVVNKWRNTFALAKAINRCLKFYSFMFSYFELYN